MKKKLLAYVGSGDITKEDVQKLTHINIAFGHIHSDGTISAKDHRIVKLMPEMRKWNPDIKIILSIVEAGGSGFSICCKREELREKAASNLAAIVKECDLDGVDLDWEYPCSPCNGSNVSADDKQNFTLLCKAIRQHLNSIDGEKRILSIAAGADVYYLHCVELPELMKYLDYICLMTYDLKCGFHSLSGHHTPLYSNVGDVLMNSCDQALRLFHESGVPKEKLLMGAAFYSRKWVNLNSRNHGLLQISDTRGSYGPDYDVLVKEYINKNGYIRYWDNEAKAPYLFDGSSFLSYDDEESLRLKAKYTIEHGYGGVFYWEHKCDKTRVLLNALYQELKEA